MRHPITPQPKIRVARGDQRRRFIVIKRTGRPMRGSRNGKRDGNM